MKIKRISIITKKEHELDLDVTQEQLDSYYNTHTLLQDAFPHLSDSDREFIKSGITAEEWDKFIAIDKED